MEKQLIKLKELAFHLDVSERTIHRWIQDNKIPYYQANNSNATYRFNKEEVLNSLKVNKSKSIMTNVDKSVK